MGAVMLLSGVLAAVATLPIFDRILIQKPGITMCILCPLAAASWGSLIWAGKEGSLLPFLLSWVDNLNHPIIVKSHNTAALFVIFVVIGVCSITVIPVGIKLGVELTKNPDGSSFVLWFLYGALFPPYNRPTGG